MDLVQVIEKEQLRNDYANVEIGDFVKVHLKIKEGNRERVPGFRRYRYCSQGRRSVGDDDCPSCVVWCWRGNGFCRFIRPKSTRSRLFAKVKLDAPSSTTCVIVSVKLRRSKRNWLTSKSNFVSIV